MPKYIRNKETSIVKNGISILINFSTRKRMPSRIRINPQNNGLSKTLIFITIIFNY
jgi:hypothetical protein